MFLDILGNKIKMIRLNLNLNQDEFCNKLNIDITNASLSRIEKGKQMPSAEFVKDVVEAFNVSPYWLLDINDNGIKQNNILDKYDLLSNNDKDNLDKYLEFLLLNNKSNLSTWESTENVEENKKSS